jgi:hypothetical protein
LQDSFLHRRHILQETVHVHSLKDWRLGLSMLAACGVPDYSTSSYETLISTISVVFETFDCQTSKHSSRDMRSHVNLGYLS